MNRVFQLLHDADSNDSSGKGSISLQPQAIVARFGKPMPFDKYKVSGTYTFIDDLNNVYTLSDHKSTTLYANVEYGPDSGAPTPEEFWAGNIKYRFKIGGKGDCDIESFMLL